MSSPIRIMGLMSGTSSDGLDASCLEFSRPGKQARELWSGSVPYPTQLKSRVLRLQEPKTRVSILELLELNRDLGRWYASSCKSLMKGRTRPDAIANHGQTVAHHPQSRVTLQLGDPAILAAETGITTISHFREGDLAVAGQGAPLMPRYHLWLFQALRKSGNGAILNIGGASNISCTSSIKDPSKLKGFDTGPGNYWIDAAAELATSGRMKMDQDGAMAQKGIIDVEAVQRVLKHPFFRIAPPKSTGRDDFPFQLLLNATKARGADLVATATAITVESIGRAVDRWVKADEIWVCGGGAYNRTLMRWLQERITSSKVRSIEAMGLKPDLIEAQGFSYLGWLSLRGESLTLKKGWTGAQAFAPPGRITPGENWARLLSKIRHN